MTCLIDADSLLYKIGFALEDKIDWDCDDKHEYYSNFEQQCNSIENKVNNIMTVTGCDDYELWLTGANNFRDSNPLGYKENREGVRKPTDFSKLKKWLINNMNTKVAIGLEADDMVVYLKDTNFDTYILCAIDKDVLYQCEGSHYNYGKEVTVEVSAKHAIWFAYHQTLTGDVTDGYKGCPRIGEVKAKKLINDGMTELEMWNIVVEAYETAGLSEEEALQTMRLANMKQYNGKEIVLWTPPSS